jgi:hypothetical protein
MNRFRYGLTLVGTAFFISFVLSGAVFANDLVMKPEKPDVVPAEEVLSISGIKFNDLNYNGFMDWDEPGLSNWTIRLVHMGTETLAATNESGYYIFSDLKPGDYILTEDLQTGWNQTAPGGGSYQITLTDRAARNYNFGNYYGEVPTLDRELPKFPIMPLSLEEALREQEVFEDAPKILIDPEIARELAPLYAFSLLPYLQYNAVQRDQGLCGDCWVWASTGVIEIDRTVRTGNKDRLSIQYLNSKYNNGGGDGNDWACCGGRPDTFANFYNSWNTWPIFWSNTNAHFQDGDRECCHTFAPDGQNCLVYHSTNVPINTISTSRYYHAISMQAQVIPTIGVGKGTAIENIKNVLHQNKAIYFGFRYPTKADWITFGNFWAYQPESFILNPDYACGDSWVTPGGGEHAVLCVGYDDTDPNNRYWIMLNSWGTAGGNRPNGLFRVSMDMNYDCTYSPGISAYQWWTFDVVSKDDGVGMFRPSNSRFYLDFNKDGITDKSVVYGLSSDKPISGDWLYQANGIGMFRPSTGMWYLDYNSDGITDYSVRYGLNGDVPISGSWGPYWNDGIGVFRPSTGMIYLDYDRNGVTDHSFKYGISGDIPISGDWDGDWYDGIGMFRPNTGMFYLDNNRDGITDHSVRYGNNGDIPISGDWDGDGKDGIGVFRPSNGRFYLDNNLDGITDKIITYGLGTDKPTIGSWS